MNESLERLINGYREFYKQYVEKRYAVYRIWARKTQEPRVMMIACSDSRVNPAILTHAGLGEVFVVNNIANLVPPYKEGKDTHHSTSAAVEYALNHLKVEHIVILGHSGCGGIKALMDGNNDQNDGSYSFIRPWVEIANDAKTHVLKKYPLCNHDEQIAHCEKESLLVSLRNLETFPWVKTALDEGRLTLHAWYFDVETGVIEQYSAQDKKFTSLL